MREDVRMTCWSSMKADDPHGAFAFKTEQGIQPRRFLLFKRGPIFPEAFEFSTGSRIQGMASSAPQHLFLFPRETLLYIAVVSDHSAHHGWEYGCTSPPAIPKAGSLFHH